MVSAFTLVPKKIEVPTVDLYGPEGFVGAFNEYEYLDIRVQIRAKNLEGYHFFTNGEKVKINSLGKEQFSNGLQDPFPFIERFLDLLIFKSQEQLQKGYENPFKTTL